jgi:hypothetical protein
MLTRMLFINLYVCIIVINLVCLLVKRSNKYLKCKCNSPLCFYTSIKLTKKSGAVKYGWKLGQ